MIIILLLFMYCKGGTVIYTKILYFVLFLFIFFFSYAAEEPCLKQIRLCKEIMQLEVEFLVQFRFMTTLLYLYTLMYIILYIQYPLWPLLYLFTWSVPERNSKYYF